MTSTSNSSSVTFLTADEHKASGPVLHAASDYDYRKAMSNPQTKQRALDFLGQFDAQDSLSTVLKASIDDDWRTYAPLLFLPETLGLDIKVPDFAPIICPNSTTVSRDPAYTLEVDTSQNPEERIKFIAKGASVDNLMHDLGRKAWETRRYGTGWRADRDDLADIPIDFIGQRLRVYEADRRRFRNSWVAATLYEATSGTFESTYDNVYTCVGARSTGTKAADTKATSYAHHVGVEDILLAKKNFRTILQRAAKPAQAIGAKTRGQDYYQPEILVLDPSLEADLCLEIYRKGFSSLGPENLSSQVRTNANLSDFFGMTVVSMPTYNWLPSEIKTPENWDWNAQAYILDTRALREIVREAVFSQNYFVEKTRQWCWSIVSRTNFVLADALAVMRLQPAAGTDITE